MRPKRLLAVAVPMLVVVAGAPPASGVVAPRAQGQHANRSADFFDVRAQARGIASRMAPAARGPQAVASVDRLTGTARNLARLDGTLSGPAAGSPRDVAWRFARAHAPEIGITAADFASFGSATVRTSRSGITSVRWRQLFRGVPALDNGLRVHLDRGNRVLSVQGSPVHGLRVGSVTPELSAEQALRALMDSVGARRAVTVTSRSSDARRETRFSTGDRARLVLFHGRGTRLAWSVTYRASSTAWYHAVVDARTGEVLRRSNLVDHATPVTVFENYPGAPNGGTQQPRDLETLGYVPAGATTLSGPFAQTYLDVDDSDTADAGENVAPGVYPFQSFNLAVGADGFCQPAKLCAWDPDVRDSWETNRQEAAVQAHYYVSRFHDHLRNSPAAFTVDEGNFEDADRVIVNANDGADTEGDGGPDIFHVDNANMATPPDGDSPRMQMYLFEPFTDEGAPFRAINGDDDATIVYHEYTHGLSSRLVTDAEGVQALNSFQAGSMGEAWSDWYAKDFLVRQGLELDDPDTDADIYVGEYSDGLRGLIRTEAIDCSVGAPESACPGGVDATGDGENETGPGGYTYGDLVSIVGFPEVHADGEIWGQTLWDLRQRLVAQEGSETAGSDLAEQLVTDGMRLSPPEPSFLDMRNAILQADVAASGGANRDLLWSVFAARGMGYFAGTFDANDIEAVEDFANPPAPGGPTGTITGKLTDGTTGAPVVGQTVGVGGHATDPSFADALVTESGADGRYTLTVPVGTYRNVTIEGGGFNTVHLDDVAVTAGSSTTFDATLTRNWASPDSGAKAETNDDAFAEIGCGVGELVDGTGDTGWSAYQEFADPPPFFPPNPHAGDEPVATIELAAPIDISEFLMDPGPACGDDPTSMTKRYRVETSADGTTFQVAKEDTFHVSAANTMNTVKPDSNATGVRFVRLTLLESFKPFSSGSLFIDFSELSIVGAPRNVLPAGTLAASPAGATPNQAVTLTASFTDPDSAITGYDWDFDGNGTMDQSTSGPTATTSYAAAGTYAPRVSVKDYRGGAGTATASVTVAVPIPPPPGGGDRPDMTLRRTGTRSRIAFRVTCDSACAGRATVTLTKRAARQLDLKRRRAGSTAIALTRPGTRQLRVRLSSRVRRAMRREGVRRVRATLAVKLTDAERQTRTRKATVRIRR